MIESLISPEVAERKPWEAFIAGFVFTLVSAFLTLYLGSTSAGFLFVAFITIGAAPFFVHIFDVEEQKEGKKFLNRHNQVLEIFAYFFVSVIIASSLVYVLVPQQTTTVLFSDQIQDLCSRNIISDTRCSRTTASTGQAFSIFSIGGQAASNAVNPEFTFLRILTNNLEVLLLAFIFSLMLGAGAVYLISWNATVIGVLIGKIAENPPAFGLFEVAKGNLVMNYLAALPYTLLRLLPHGIFEFGGYFFGAVAGGILSVAIVREKIKQGRFMPVLKDSLIYLGISVGLIFIGALIEVSI